MKRPYCIKRIPNTQAGNRAAKILRAKGEAHHRKRGRGARSKENALDLSLERATHFSFYGYPIKGWSYVLPYQYFGFVGWKNKKPIIRQLLDPKS
jgi:hypothetical protein